MNSDTPKKSTGHDGSQEQVTEIKRTSNLPWIAAFVVSVTLLIAIAIALAVVATRKSETNASPKEQEMRGQEVCNTKQCIQAASSMLSNIDYTTDPCEDFYDFVCGNYDYHLELPQEAGVYGKLHLMIYRVEKAVKEILEEPVTNTEFKGLKMAKKFFKSCKTQDDTYSDEGWKDWKNDIAETLVSWPMKDGEWTAPISYSWEDQVVLLMKNGIGTILSVNVYQNLKNTAKNAILMMAESPDESYYNEKTIASMNGKTFLNDSKDLQDMKDLMNKVPYDPQALAWKTIKEIKIKIPNVNWDIIFSIFPKQIRINENDIVMVISWEQFAQNLNVLSQSRPRIVQNYIRESFERGVDQLQPEEQKKWSYARKWKSCIKKAVKYFGYIISAEYVERHMDDEHAGTVKEMTLEIRNVLTEKIQKAEWLDEETRSHALAKVDLMALSVGYPKYLFNKTFLMQGFDQIDIQEGNLFQNTLYLDRMLVEKNLNSLRDPIPLGPWLYPPVTMNAFYAPLNNEMVFPAAILQFPALSGKVPAYLNYGRLGMMIGHEMTHGFDITGHKHDESGNLAMWWTNSTYAKFLNKAQCFRTQFSNIKDPDVRLKGNITLGENMADTGGVKLAYVAYMKWLSKHPNVPTLPGMNKYTAEQLFFIVLGNFWCELYTPKGRIKTLSEDRHSLARYRVNFSLKNLPAFGASFNCPKISKMTPEQRCEMW